MFSFCALPTILIRLLVEFVVLVLAVFLVLPRHRTAGLVMASGAALDLLVGLAIPTLELLGMGLLTNAGGFGSDIEWMFLMFVFLPLVTPLAQAFNMGCIAAAIVMLAQRVPREEPVAW